MGSTFIEMLVSVVLLGTVGIAVLTAMTAAAVAARTSDEISEAQAVVAEAGDALTDTNPVSDNYVSCASGEGPVRAAYQAIVDGLGLPYPVNVVGVEFWSSGGAWGGAAESWSASTCNYPNDRLQRIQLITSVNGSTRSLNVIKRPTAAPTTVTVAAPTPPAVSGGGGGVDPAPTPGIDGP